jgi:transcriptional regulator with XRE-family HTH domain
MQIWYKICMGKPTKNPSLGMTQEEIADALGVDQATVSRWLSGKRDARVSEIARIAEVTRKTTEEIFSIISQNSLA